MHKAIGKRNTPRTPLTKNTPVHIAWRQKPRNGRLPITQWRAFAAAHREVHELQLAYQAKNLKEKVSLSADVLQELEPHRAHLLQSNNLDARLSFARCMARRVGEHAEMITDRQILLFVTLMIEDHTVREDEAFDFDLRRVQGLGHYWLGKVLRGCSYIAMAEGAFFVNLSETGASYDRAVSWHLHAIVWGVTEAELKAMIAAFNRKYRAAVPGIRAGHQRALDPSEVEGQALYMTKGQLSRYKIWERKKDGWNDSGVVTMEGTGRFSVKKEMIRRGEAARMYRVFHKRYLDQLAFAGGEGREILRAVIREVRSPHGRHRDERRVARRRLQPALDAKPEKRPVVIVLPPGLRRR